MDVFSEKNFPEVKSTIAGKLQPVGTFLADDERRPERAPGRSDDSGRDGIGSKP